jgi:hypothetical protein
MKMIKVGNNKVSIYHRVFYRSNKFHNFKTKNIKEDLTKTIQLKRKLGLLRCTSNKDFP